MPINYSARKKVDKTGDEPRELYYAVAKALQSRNNSATERDLAELMSKVSTLTTADVMAVLTLLPWAIAEYLKMSRTINIEGLGTFFTSLTSEGVETPEELTADKVRISRICYKADKKLKEEVMSTSLFNMERRIEKLEENREGRKK